MTFENRNRAVKKASEGGKSMESPKAPYNESLFRREGFFRFIFMVAILFWLVAGWLFALVFSVTGHQKVGQGLLASYILVAVFSIAALLRGGK